jgi:hypothetical protein
MQNALGTDFSVAAKCSYKGKPRTQFWVAGLTLHGAWLGLPVILDRRSREPAW